MREVTAILLPEWTLVNSLGRIELVDYLLKVD